MRKLLLLSSVSLLLIFGCGNNSDKTKKNETLDELNGKLTIFHAGSLSVPFKQIKEAFEKENPKVKVILESAGSRKCARKITDLKKECDIMASADYTVIDKLLIPDYASWNIKFASNEMALVFHEGSEKADEISAENWYKILADKKVAFGRSDPNADPCGYRAVLTMKLAEQFYKEAGLAEKLIAKDNNYIRPKETDLLALLESNTIDYIFLYRSVAEQHKLKYIILPDEINLKDPKHSDFYSNATIEISGKKPGEFITKRGEPMVYGVTLVKNAPNEKAAKAFTKFLLEKEKGMQIMEKNGQPSMVPAYSESYDKIPAEFQKFAAKNK